MCENLQVTSPLQIQFISKYWLIFSSWTMSNYQNVTQGPIMKWNKENMNIKSSKVNITILMCYLAWTLCVGWDRDCCAHAEIKGWWSNQWEYKEGKNLYQMCFILSNIFFSVDFKENVLFNHKLLTSVFITMLRYVYRVMVITRLIVGCMITTNEAQRARWHLKSLHKSQISNSAETNVNVLIMLIDYLTQTKRST